MAEEVGKENMFIFGMSSDEVIAHEQKRDYDPMQIFNNDQDVRKVLNAVNQRILIHQMIRNCSVTFTTHC